MNKVPVSTYLLDLSKGTIIGKPPIIPREPKRDLKELFFSFNALKVFKGRGDLMSLLNQTKGCQMPNAVHKEDLLILRQSQCYKSTHQTQASSTIGGFMFFQ